MRRHQLTQNPPLARAYEFKSRLRHQAADYPFDQVSASFPNRVRVGFITSLSAGLDEWRRGTVHLAEQFPAAGDADVYFNWGCEEGELQPACAEPRPRDGDAMAGPSAGRAERAMMGHRRRRHS